MFKRFDIFPKISNSDFRVRTSFGGFLTVITVLSFFLDLYFEIIEMKGIKNQEKIGINQREMPHSIPFSVDMFVFNDCKDLHLDVMNQKRTFDLECDYQDEFKQVENFCVIRVNGSIPTVPGSFHIGLGENYYNDKGDHAHMWIALKNKNLSHHINTIKFGKNNIGSHIENSRIVLPKSNAYMITYNIQLIPIDDGITDGYQIIASLTKTNLEKIRTKGIPAIIFEWSFSPLELKMRTITKPLIHHISHIFAMFGTFFVCVRFLDHVLFKYNRTPISIK